MKRTPLLRKKPMQRAPFSKKPRKGLRAVSTRRRRELKEYAERRASFLALPENRWCPVVAAGVCEITRTGPVIEDETLKCGIRVTIRKIVPYTKRRATDIHHKAGREGKRLNDEHHWLAVSREGHEWIHANPNEARRRGWLI